MTQSGNGKHANLIFRSSLSMEIQSLIIDVSMEVISVLTCNHWNVWSVWAKGPLYVILLGKKLQLLSARNFKELYNLVCYLQHAFERREIILRTFSRWLVSVFVIFKTPCHVTHFFLLVTSMYAMRCMSSATKYITMSIQRRYI